MQTMEKRGGSTVAPVNPKRSGAPWVIAFYQSAVGKKWVMAITGLLLMGFVFSHMIGNLHLYQSAAEMNHYGEFLREILEPIFPRTVFLWLIRVVLIAAFALHIHAAATLTLMNRRANAGQYNQARDWQQASFASRSMRLTGIVILAYLFFHLADLTWGASLAGEWERGDVYGNVLDSLSYAPIAAVYIVANIALGVHLYHGGWSMFQSLGLNNPKYNDFRRKFALGFAVLVTVGNLSFPLAVQFGLVDDDDCVENGDDYSCLVEEAAEETE